MAQEKEYTGSFTLGATTPTYDLESTPVDFKSLDHLLEADIYAATAPFTGEIYQTPPIHSAIKKDGKPAYLAARKGEDIKLEPRKITIHQFEITRIELPVVDFRVVCTTGTYIRTLANDFGAHLGVGAHLSKLCRTRIGDYNLKDALEIEGFTEKIQALKSNEQ